jgi:hypothetical protein
LDPYRAAPYTLKPEPKRVKDRTDIVEPRLKKSIIESSVIWFERPYIESDEPQMSMDRTERDEPKSTESSTESVEPMRTAPKIDIVLPK